MAALIQAKLTPQAAVSAMTTGSRFGGSDAVGGEENDSWGHARTLSAVRTSTCVDTWAASTYVDGHERTGRDEAAWGVHQECRHAAATGSGPLRPERGTLIRIVDGLIVGFGGGRVLGW